MASLTELDCLFTAQPGIKSANEDLFELSVRAVVLALLRSLPRYSNPIVSQEQWLQASKANAVQNHPVVTDELAALDWVVQLSSDGSGYIQETAAAMDEVLSEQHLLKRLGHLGMIKSHRVFFSPSNLQLLNCYSLGPDVCGHPGIVHGGFSATLMDESFGYLAYLAKHHGKVDFKMVFTAHLEVDYKKPLPANSIVVCRAFIQSIEGLKLWLGCELRDSPEGEVYATGKALFVIPKDPPKDSAGTAHQA